MSNQDNGGPAFPVPAEFFSDGSMRRPSGDGLSVRDYMAAKALAAVPMPQGHMHDEKAVYDRIASHCYKMADAMLAARGQQ